MIPSSNFFQSTDFLNKEQNFLKKHNFVKILSSENVLIDFIPYATDKNFCNLQLYSHPFLYLHKDAHDNLLKAIKIADLQGFSLRIWDCYRPYEIQSFFAHKFPNYVKNGFISHPKDGVATHVRGIAIDLTLVDKKSGLEIDMGTYFDNMDEKSHHHYQNINPEIFNNRQKLAKIMNEAGFETYENEWWHYNLKIFKYNNGEIIGSEENADKLYPKIPPHEFDELIHSNLIKAY